MVKVRVRVRVVIKVGMPEYVGSEIGPAVHRALGLHV